MEERPYLNPHRDKEIERGKSWNLDWNPPDALPRKRKAALTDHDNAKAQNVESLTAYFGRLSLDDPNPGPHVFEVLSQWTRAYPERFRPPPVSAPVNTPAYRFRYEDGRYANLYHALREEPSSANLANDIRTGEPLATDAAYFLGIPLAPDPTFDDARRGLLQRLYWDDPSRSGARTYP